MIISLCGQLNDPNPKVGVVDVEVVGDAPHDDQVHPLFLQLPGQSARGSRETGRRKNCFIISRKTLILAVCTIAENYNFELFEKT